MNVQTVKIGRSYVGGQVGYHPTILIGTMVVENIGVLDTPQTYRFEENKVQENFECSTLDCRKAGVPAMVALSAETEEAIKKQVAFVVDKTDCPFIIQGTTP